MPVIMQDLVRHLNAKETYTPILERPWLCTCTCEYKYMHAHVCLYQCLCVYILFVKVCCCVWVIVPLNVLSIVVPFCLDAVRARCAHSAYAHTHRICQADRDALRLSCITAYTPHRMQRQLCCPCCCCIPHPTLGAILKIAVGRLGGFRKLAAAADVNNPLPADASRLIISVVIPVRTDYVNVYVYTHVNIYIYIYI